MPKILLIDDELDVRDSVAAVLQRDGFEVTAAENVTDGMQALSGQDFDVIVTDVIMPGFDGVEAIKRIRESNPTVKIIAISGGGNIGLTSYQPEAITTTAYLQAATEAGADAILTKPFGRADIVGAVREILSEEI